MHGTHLTEQDRENAFTLRWLVSYLKENSENTICKNYASDAYDLISDILTEDYSHTDIVGENPLFKHTQDEIDSSIREYKKIPVKGKVAIVIGHNKNTGARTHDGSDEWTTRKLVAEELQDYLGVCGVESKIFIRDGKMSYGDAMREHGKNIDAWGADVAVELHFNSASNKDATGTEFICCSDVGKGVAGTLASNWGDFYPDMPLRRDNGIYFKTSGSGVGFCKAPKCPAVVYEPFFASNPKDWIKFKGLAKKEATALGNGLVNWLRKNK